MIANQFQNIASNWTPDYYRKASTIQRTTESALDEMLHVALENAINCEADGMQERQLYWLAEHDPAPPAKVVAIRRRRKKRRFRAAVFG